jgi:hypothetical protein
MNQIKMQKASISMMMASNPPKKLIKSIKLKFKKFTLSSFIAMAGLIMYLSSKPVLTKSYKTS